MLYLSVSIQLRDRNHTSNSNKEKSPPRIVNQSKGTENPREEEADTWSGLSAEAEHPRRNTPGRCLPSQAWDSNLVREGDCNPLRWSGNLPRCFPLGLVSRKLPVRVPVRHTRGWASLSLHSTVRSSQGAKTTKSWNQNEKPLPLPVILSALYTSWQRTNVYRVQLEDHKAKEGRVG